jgi:hypothetical protein
MDHRPLDPALMRHALAVLDTRLEKPTRLVIGGGAAMVLAYEHTMATQDVDAFTAKGSTSMAELDTAAKATARELDIEPDWLNPHFETYTGVLPTDYAQRLRRIFDGENLIVDALGPEDLLLMKCFAGRDKDRPHARRLALRDDIDLSLVDANLSRLVERRYPSAERAADYFDDLRDELGR